VKLHHGGGRGVRFERLLVVDIASGVMSVAIRVGDDLYTHDADPAERGVRRSTTILPILGDLMRQAGITWQDLDLLAWGAGPGSFTGLRIAAATLAGINSGLRLPILHLDSLAVTARQSGCAAPVWVVEDARAGEAFVGCYHDGAVIQPPRCCRYDELAEWVPSDGSAYCTAWQLPPLAWLERHYQPPEQPRSEALMAEISAQLADNRALLAAYPEPRYLQRSQAERSLNG